MKHSSGFYPRVRVDAGGSGVVSHAGAAALTETVRAVGLDRALSGALGPWRKPFAAGLGQPGEQPTRSDQIHSVRGALATRPRASCC